MTTALKSLNSPTQHNPATLNVLVIQRIILMVGNPGLVSLVCKTWQSLADESYSYLLEAYRNRDTLRKFVAHIPQALTKEQCKAHLVAFFKHILRAPQNLHSPYQMLVGPLRRPIPFGEETMQSDLHELREMLPLTEVVARVCSVREKLRLEIQQLNSEDPAKQAELLKLRARGAFFEENVKAIVKKLKELGADVIAYQWLWPYLPFIPTSASAAPSSSGPPSNSSPAAAPQAAPSTASNSSSRGSNT